MFEDKTDEYIEAVKQQIDDNMTKLTNEYQADVKDKLDVPPARTGRTYRNIAGKEHHVASAPGEPPAPLTRALIESIETNIEGDKGTSWMSHVFSDKPYALYLALGTSKMNARPYWRPALVENRDKYAEIATVGFKRRH